MKNTIVGLGEILWDVFPERKVLGGAPANFAYHISQFGFQGHAVSAIGKDLLGKEILASLEKKQLNYLIEQTDFPTGEVKVKLDNWVSLPTTSKRAWPGTISPLALLWKTSPSRRKWSVSVP